MSRISIGKERRYQVPALKEHALAAGVNILPFDRMKYPEKLICCNEELLLVRSNLGHELS